MAARGIGVLPQCLDEAITALEADAVVQGALGAALSTEFVRLKRAEWSAYARHVSAWELGALCRRVLRPSTGLARGLAAR